MASRSARRAGRWLVIGGLIVAGATVYVAYRLRESLPRHAGQVVAGVSARASIARDQLGVARIQAANENDAAYSLGFLHAQERAFQMDLHRRWPAGELSALLGSATLNSDRDMRTRRYRTRARYVLDQAPSSIRSQLDAYAAGVNAGLSDLGERPPEYLLLRQSFLPWLAEDSILCAFLFFERLSDNTAYEREVHTLRETLPRPLADFLTPETSRFDAPIPGGPQDAVDPTGGHRAAAIPDPSTIDLRKRTPRTARRDLVRARGAPVSGSNNFAVAGSRTSDGRAILANDPHLRLDMPNVWYRAEISVAGRSTQGVTIPGLPGMVIGANEDIAWGFTNGPGDHEDLVVIEVDPSDPSRYLSPDGIEPFIQIAEEITVKDADPVKIVVRETRFGPVIGDDYRGRPLALRSTALAPESVNLALLALPHARTVDEAIDILRTWYGPAQNALIADRHGEIGWVVTGFLPRRIGFDGKSPTRSTDKDTRWDGQISERDRPMQTHPDNGTLFSANGRTIPFPSSRAITTAWESPVRARRIRGLLEASEQHDEASLAKIQRDTRNELLDPYVALLKEAASSRNSTEVTHLAETWDGHADTDSAGYPLIREFRHALLRRILTPLLEDAGEADDAFVYRWPLMDEPLLQITDARPDHLLPPGDKDWASTLGGALDDAIETVARISSATGDRPPTAIAWGDIQRARIRHPLARGEDRAAAILGHWLNMRDDPLPGDVSTVRAQSASHGASLRLVASPALLERALFQMPGGQSGHPWSPHYDDHHPSWVRGESLPLQFGTAASTFILLPPE